jgi:hypothetical protein
MKSPNQAVNEKALKEVMNPLQNRTLWIANGKAQSLENSFRSVQRNRQGRMNRLEIRKIIVVC